MDTTQPFFRPSQLSAFPPISELRRGVFCPTFHERMAEFTHLCKLHAVERLLGQRLNICLIRIAFSNGDGNIYHMNLMC
jgi:hypothetical protein